MNEERLLTPGEVAVIFKVQSKTVSRWAQQGKLPCIRTLGGHRRFKARDVFEALKLQSDGPSP